MDLKYESSPPESLSGGGEKEDGMDRFSDPETLLDCVRARRSVRSFDGSPLTPEQERALAGCMERTDNPWGVPLRIRLLPAKEYGLRSMVIVGAAQYLAAKGPKGPALELAVGFTLERVILCAQSLGLGTVWLGGTFDRPAFSAAMELGPDERMPCVVPVGRAAARMSLRESAMRKGTKASSRKPFEELFFDGGFDRPLTRAAAGRLALPLEAVRLAPSAVNRQPWRVVLRENELCFYLCPSKGGRGAAVGELQKVDLGIALCHAFLSAEALGLALVFCAEDPGLPHPPELVYIGAWRINNQIR